jgi:hypothetical protein
MFARMLLSIILVLMMIAMALPTDAQEKPKVAASQGYAGSESCKQCHERFYQLWSTSKHGLAMQALYF